MRPSRAWQANKIRRHPAQLFSSKAQTARRHPKGQARLFMSVIHGINLANNPVRLYGFISAARWRHSFTVPAQAGMTKMECPAAP
jgi:hypothetical protein